MARRKRDPWSMRLNRALFPVFGPAQLGAGRPEQPFSPTPDPICPMCGQAMAAHRVERTADQSHATRLYCPAPPT